MSNFYKSLKNTSARIIKEKGQVIVITHTEEGAYDPSTGLSPSTTTSQKALAVLLDYGSREIDGTIITIADKKLLVSPKKPDGTDLDQVYINDTAFVDGVNYTIKTPLVEIKPNGTAVVLYKLNVRA